MCAADAISAAPRLRRDSVRWGMVTAAQCEVGHGHGCGQRAHPRRRRSWRRPRCLRLPSYFFCTCKWQVEASYPLAHTFQIRLRRRAMADPSTAVARLQVKGMICDFAGSGLRASRPHRFRLLLHGRRSSCPAGGDKGQRWLQVQVRLSKPTIKVTSHTCVRAVGSAQACLG